MTKAIEIKYEKGTLLYLKRLPDSMRYNFKRGKFSSFLVPVVITGDICYDEKNDRVRYCLKSLFPGEEVGAVSEEWLLNREQAILFFYEEIVPMIDNVIFNDCSNFRSQERIL